MRSSSATGSDEERVSRRWVFALAVATLLAAFPGGARADGAAAASETARSLFNEGLALRAHGDLEGAVKKLRAAHALRATPLTALELARTYVETRDLVEARDLALSIRRLPVAAVESRETQAARRDGTTLADELKSRIPSLAITLTGAGAGPNATVSVDGIEIPSAAVTEPQRLNPKRHHVVARATGAREVAADIELGEGENARIVLELVPTPEGAKPAPPSDGGAGGRTATLPKLFVYGGGSLAFVGVVFGTFEGIRALDQVSALKGACNQDKVCAPNQSDAISSAKNAGSLATFAFTAAGAGATLALVGLLLWPRSESVGSPTVSLSAGPMSLAVQGRFR
jgi:hypothetical protein